MAKSSIKKVAILTSGGDSAGMSSAVKGTVLACLNNKLTPYFVYEGFRGLYEDNIKEAKKKDVDHYDSVRGTAIFSERFPEFKDPKIRKVAISNLKKRGIDALVVIGGDGSYMGANLLNEEGIKTIGLPGTIDNDISTTDFTIGFWSSLECIVESIKSINATAMSHNRAMIIEVMGRHCGELALNAAIATSSHILSTSERKLSEEEIIKQIAASRKQGNRAIIAVVTENLYDVKALAKRVEAETKIVTRADVLGNLQRGARVVPADQLLAKSMSAFAVGKLMEGKSGMSVNIVGGKIVGVPLMKTVKTKKRVNTELYNLYNFVK